MWKSLHSPENSSKDACEESRGFALTVLSLNCGGIDIFHECHYDVQYHTQNTKCNYEKLVSSS